MLSFIILTLFNLPVIFIFFILSDPEIQEETEILSKCISFIKPPHLVPRWLYKGNTLTKYFLYKATSPCS